MSAAGLGGLGGARDAPAGQLPGAGVFLVNAHERIVLGTPAEEAVVADAGRYGARRVFIVSTGSLARAERGPLQRIERALGAAHAGTYAGVRSHSPREDVVAGANAARAAKADLIVAVGGGSVIDSAKAMLLCLWLGLDTPEAMQPYSSGFQRTYCQGVALPAEPIRMVSVSTTLSGAEFTDNAGIMQTGTGAKQSFRHRLFAPRTVVLDPAATLDTPLWLLFSTGIRAVDHAVETYCNARASLATEGLSLNGLRLLNRALLAIKADPADLAARHEAQIGMWQAIAALAAGVPTGASHGIGYALGSGFGVAHGHTSCVMLPAVLRWNTAVNGERQRALSQTMGAPDRPAAELVRALIAGLGLPVTLREVGINRSDVDEVARRALDYHPLKVNPRPIASVADVKEILELAW
jgi:maleylacetate reductase